MPSQIGPGLDEYKFLICILNVANNGILAFVVAVKVRTSTGDRWLGLRKDEDSPFTRAI